MNTKNNRRRSETDEHLKQCYIALFLRNKGGEITVSEFCKQAGINRATFYSRYEDIIDFECCLASEIYQDAHKKLTADIHDKPGTRFRKLFKFLFKNKDGIRIYLNSAARSHIMGRLTGKEMQEMSSKELDLLRPKRNPDICEFIYRKRMFNDGLTGIVCAWINGNCKESPEKMAEYVLSFEKDLFQLSPAQKKTKSPSISNNK